MKIFGDDGFRDIYSKGLMSEKFLNNFFTKLDNFLHLKKINKIIIGYDTNYFIFKIVLLLGQLHKLKNILTKYSHLIIKQVYLLYRKSPFFYTFKCLNLFHINDFGIYQKNTG